MMKRPDMEVVKDLAIISRQFPRVAEWLAEWAGDELSSLPMAKKDLKVAQGRCQVLKEFSELLDKAPNTVAKPSRTPLNSTHTNRSV
mgnify:CR=1 FL=1